MTSKASPPKAPPQTPESDPTRHTRRNYWVFVLEGGFYTSGIAFVALDTVIPSIAQEFGGGDTLVAFLPTLMFLGFCLPQIFTMRWMERITRYFPFVRATGFLQRIVYLVTAIVLWVLPEDQQMIALLFVAGTPLISGILGGITISGWMRMTARTVAGNKRSSATALRNLIGALTGILAGICVEWTLEHQPGMRGVGSLHMKAFGFLAVSFIFFLFTDEPEGTARTKEQQKGSSTFSDVLEILKGDRGFRFYLMNRISAMLMFVLVPFMAIHAIATTESGIEFSGRLLAFQMGGNILGNVLGGLLGDRRGSRIVLICARCSFIATSLLVMLSAQPLGFCIAFALWGITFSMQAVGEQTFIVEHAFGRRFPVYTTIASVVIMIMMIVSGTLAATMRHQSDSIYPLGLTALGGVVVSLFVLITLVKEPRKMSRVVDA